MDLDDVTPDDDPQPGLDLVPTLTLPRRSAIDWDRTRLTPGLVRALAKAQAEARTVGKSSTIEGRGSGDNAVKARKYAGADAMIEEATRVLAPNGLAWVCASTSRQATDPRHAAECGDKQWVCSVVETTSLLMHAPEVGGDGVAAVGFDEVGVLVTYGETASIGRAGTPIDKADKAAETYLRLYLARDLVGLDRGDEAGADDDPNRRDDTDSAAGRGTTRTTSRKETVIRDAIAMRCKSINAVRKTSLGLAYASAQQLIDQAIGEPFHVNTPDDAQRALDALDRLLLKVNADARQE